MWKRRNATLLTMALLLSSTSTVATAAEEQAMMYQQIGSDIRAQVRKGDYFGLATIAISGDGNTVAFGLFDEGVRSYRYDGRHWKALGPVELPNRQSSYYGSSLALSHDGTTLAIGSLFGGDYAVSVFKRSRSEWTLFGRIPNYEHETFYGLAVALSRDADLLAVGKPFGLGCPAVHPPPGPFQPPDIGPWDDEIPEEECSNGTVELYDLTKEPPSWGLVGLRSDCLCTELPEDVNCDYSKNDRCDGMGFSLALSHNGRFLASVSQLGRETSDRRDEIHAAFVHLYEHKESGWEKRADLMNEVQLSSADLNIFSLAVADSGEVVAVGVPPQMCEGAGQVIIHRHSQDSQEIPEWSTEEPALNSSDLLAGSRVALSSDANKLAVAGDTTANAYRFDGLHWQPMLSRPIDLGNGSVDCRVNSFNYLALSDDGNILAVSKRYETLASCYEECEQECNGEEGEHEDCPACMQACELDLNSNVEVVLGAVYRIGEGGASQAEKVGVGSVLLVLWILPGFLF